MNITIQGSTWGDVFVDGPNRIGCVYDFGIDVVVDFYGVENGTLRKRDSILFNFTERILFARGDRNDSGHILVMGQGMTTGKFRIKSRGGNYDPPRPLTTFGTHICDLQPFGNSFHYVVQVAKSTYYDSLTAREFPISGLPDGTSQGIIQLLGNDIHWSDIYRTAVPQMLFPFIDSGVAIGEGATDPAHIQAFDGEQKNIFWGVAERPRACYDDASNLFVVASRSGAGVSFNFFNKPLKDVSVVVPPTEPPVEPPPQPEPPTLSNLPEKVIKTLDRFFAAKCQRDENGNPKPPIGEDNVRDICVFADEQVAFEHPNEGWGTKRADAGRPVSKDALARFTDGRLFFWDLVSGAGTLNPKFVYKQAKGEDITGQIFIGPGDSLHNPYPSVSKFTPMNHIGTPIPNPNPDPEPEPPTIDCTPVVPTQDIIRDSLIELRNFCQNYVAPLNANPEYAGRKPYSSDEIHDNGLFIGDGLIYFMMSDTGNWAKILMNPMDLRPWNEKRISADNALQTYMRRRVGDNS